MRSDDERIKTLNIQIEKISGLAQERRRALETEVTETQAAQIELDRTAEEFRTLHLERQRTLRIKNIEGYHCSVSKYVSNGVRCLCISLFNYSPFILTELIKQWDDAVKAMARRDQVITQLAEHIAQTHV